jgi:hypothetical protein
MWHTQCGEPVLKGAEWDLFRAGLGVLWDWVEEYYEGGEDLYQTGVVVFDSLQPNQKLALLALVGKALKEEDVPPPDLTARTAGTVAAVFACIRAHLGLEIDMSGGRRRRASYPSWRSRILAAFESTVAMGDWEGPRPGPRSKKLRDWCLLLHCLEIRILEDFDFDLAPQFLSVSPHRALAVMGVMAIDPDYFYAPPPNPYDDELPAIRRTLRELTGRAVPTKP